MQILHETVQSVIFNRRLNSSCVYNNFGSEYFHFVSVGPIPSAGRAEFAGKRLVHAVDEYRKVDDNVDDYNAHHCKADLCLEFTSEQSPVGNYAQTHVEHRHDCGLVHHLNPVVSAKLKRAHCYHVEHQSEASQDLNEHIEEAYVGDECIQSQCIQKSSCEE